MSRISLKETYDNRSVIAQIAKVTDTAEDAAETVEQKAAEINDAITEVNAAVQAAEGAVTTANVASASAQQSAQTVASYNTRLTTAEGEIDTLQNDLNSVTLRVTTAEGQIVTIQGRVTALETADGQNVKLTGDQAITGIKTVPTEATGSRSQQIANSAKIGAELDNYSFMLRTTGNQIVNGTKAFQSGLVGASVQLKTLDYDILTPGTSTKYSNSIMWIDENNVAICKLWVAQSANGQIKLGCDIKNSNNTWKFGQILAQGDVI